MAEAEWGMLTMQASFPRVKDRFVYEERGEQRIVLKMFVILYNMRASVYLLFLVLQKCIPVQQIVIE